MKVFRVTYESFEGNERWTEYHMDDAATEYDVRNRISSESHVCGDEICTVISIEET